MPEIKSDMKEEKKSCSIARTLDPSEVKLTEMTSAGG